MPIAFRSYRVWSRGAPSRHVEQGLPAEGEIVEHADPGGR
jgi:hypothetical protein